jgi:NAD(P)-dependent dehydrogenase (short-subunit alcohol dehydrogenase family)
MTRRALALLERSGGGAVVNISSVMAWYTAPGYVAYTAAKAGVVGMTRALAVELGPRAYASTPSAPGSSTRRSGSGNLDAMAPEAAAAFAERVRALHPVGRRGTTADVADATLFLCSDAARFITGTHLIVDGGVSLRLTAP